MHTQTGPTHLKIKQSLTATTFSGEERGLPLHGVGDVRIIVHAPAGQTLVGDINVRLALRHGVTGLFLPFGDGALTTLITPTAGQRGAVVAEIPASGNAGDELVALAAGTTGGEPLDIEDAGFIYLVLEQLPAR